MFKLNLLEPRLREIAAQNAGYCRRLAAEVADNARTKNDERYVEQVEQQAIRWQNVAVPPPNSL